ncbi:putative nuclear RNA export factor SDE5, partial [Mucuna pruriens]
MEVSGQNLVKCDEEKALKCLLDAFGSVFSLEEIASAYCKASRNADLAGEILYEMQGSTSASTSHDSSNADGYSHESSFQERKTSRPKARPVLAGTVSSIIGKDYVRPASSANGSFASIKPTKLDAKSLPTTGIWREKSKQDVSSSKPDRLHQDMEDFLFKMLGDGFKLDRNMIRQVLHTCGYDMQKSLVKLLDPSNMASGRRTAVVGDSAGRFTDMKPKSEAPSSGRKSQDLSYPRGDGNIASTKGTELHQQQKQKHDLQKEVLSTLFNYHGHSEEAPKRIVKDLNKKSQYGHVVFEPPKDFPEEFNLIDTDFSRQEIIDDPEDEEDYQNVRRAVKEYRVAMCEYYKAAVDAFAKGDQIKAEKLLDQGQFFLRKAHEADEESNKMILETENAEAQEMVLDLRDHGSREAIRLLKCHLSSLSGIPSFEYLKVIVDANDKENTKGSRSRQKESITWVEGETAGTLLIRIGTIERKRLSFVQTKN